MGGRRITQLDLSLACIPHNQVSSLPFDPDIIVIVAVPESLSGYLSYLLSDGTAFKPVILLTSWQKKLGELVTQLPFNCLPAYPLICCEEWAGNLAAVGGQWLEVDESLAGSTYGLGSIKMLEQLGFGIRLIPMSKRFRARFAQTSFAYSYLRSHPSYEYSFPVIGFDVASAMPRLRILLASESDLLSEVDYITSLLDSLWGQRFQSGTQGWILDTLMRHKSGKTDYFLERLWLG
ncbi:hypothetical protein H8F24_09310 [Synechococcus sp. CBW1002]|uniref:hypothetical protein n=1 Tax=unclassified Synechococcus TaxID=2626047 RepID=UPI0018CF2E40|nr:MULTISPECIES: hypothetical protein [unclassified Synechococcus]QPN58445.1 hypothetical protein H8F24_09310 [Synechococcus sp. CBW1002]QPN68057.1 hypothetical protein H8F26_08230 [Synechococcus sp. CBW1006]